mgnify:CR=1 FL=1
MVLDLIYVERNPAENQLTMALNFTNLTHTYASGAESLFSRAKYLQYLSTNLPGSINSVRYDWERGLLLIDFDYLENI